MKHRYFVILGWIMLIMMSMSCNRAQKPLRPQGLKLVDTLVAKKWRILEPLEDSLCKEREAVIFEQAFDSIIQVRIEENSEMIRYDLR